MVPFDLLKSGFFIFVNVLARCSVSYAGKAKEQEFFFLSGKCDSYIILEKLQSSKTHSKITSFTTS